MSWPPSNHEALRLELPLVTIATAGTFERLVAETLLTLLARSIAARASGFVLAGVVAIRRRFRASVCVCSGKT